MATSSSWNGWLNAHLVYPDDVNNQQTFSLHWPEAASSTDGNGDMVIERDGIVELKLIFEKSSDFFGRITIYDLSLLGTVL